MGCPLDLFERPALDLRCDKIRSIVPTSRNQEHQEEDEEDDEEEEEEEEEEEGEGDEKGVK